MRATWTTRDGCSVFIDSMSNDHIRRTIRMLRRHYRRQCLAYSLAADLYASDAPYEASTAAETEARSLIEEAEKQECLTSKDVASFDELVAELRKRGLQEIEWK